MSLVNLERHALRGGMVGMGMIFDDTYRPLFESLHAEGLYRRDFGYVDVSLAAVATRTGARARAYKQAAGAKIGDFSSFEGDRGVAAALDAGLDFLCVASPDNREGGARSAPPCADRETVGAEAPAARRARRARAPQRRAREGGLP